MSTSVHGEGAFEAHIEGNLLGAGWVSGAPGNYRRDLGLDTAVLFEFLGATQVKAWERLVGVHGGADVAQHRFAKRLAAEIDSRGTVDVLRRGVEDQGIKFRLAFFKPGHALTADLVALYEKNLCVVTRQAHVSDTKPQDSVDLLLIVNGLPVATAELKNQITGQTVEHAKVQYRKDRNPKDLIFAKRVVANFAVDQDLVFLTTRLAGADTQFLPFNQGTGGPGREGGAGNPASESGYSTAYLWERVWQRDNWLDLLHRFVHEDKPSGTAKKAGPRKIIFPRFHQWDLVLRLAEDCARYGPGRNYLPQHSAGSGKSNSIAWTAHRLSTLHTPDNAALMDPAAVKAGLGANEKVFDKVIVVTDRVVLDRQLQDTIFQFDHTPGVVERIDKNSQQLANALAGAKAQIIITTLQKFPVIAKAALDLNGKRFAVLVDEAHSSQSGESAKDLKAVLGSKEATGFVDGVTTGVAEAALFDAAEAFDRALEESAGDGQDAVTANLEALRASAATRGQQANLSFFAFTATPKHKTLQLFGTRIPDPSTESGVRLEPFHLYSMRQAIEEGFILDVLANYLTYNTYFRLANGLSSDDPEVDKGKANAALARFVSLHPSSLAQKAQIIVEHYRTVTRREIGGTAKAMVVTRSRLHAVRYKQAIEGYLAEKHYTDLRALVAFSGKVEDPDTAGVEYTEPSMNRTPDGKQIPESETAKRFQGDPDHGYPIGDYQVLIVAEKYQTGFDEPLLHTMDVDKKLEGVKAVQTLSRLNRTIPGRKDGTFVLDFANSAADIAEAFKPFYEVSWSEPTDPNVLSNLKQRILSAGIIDTAEMTALVTALFAGGKDTNEALNAKTNAAVARYEEMGDPDEQEAFRTAVRDYVRLYAFLGQVLPTGSPAMEELFYYAKILAPRLAKMTGNPDAGIDLGSAAVLTHIRTEAQNMQNVSLTPGEGTGVPGMGGDGHGAQHLPDKVRLSALINMLNTKFGFEFTEVDALMWEQQFDAAAEREDLRAVAAVNTEENFGIVFDEAFADVVIDRQTANEDLFRMFFDKPEFQEALTAWARKEVYRKIMVGLGDPV